MGFDLGGFDLSKLENLNEVSSDGFSSDWQNNGNSSSLSIFGESNISEIGDTYSFKTKKRFLR